MYFYVLITISKYTTTIQLMILLVFILIYL